MHMGQATVTEPITASTEIRTHRLHPLQRTTWRDFGWGRAYQRNASPFQICRREPMKTSDGR
jgi:hypothetical protein